VAVRVHVPVPVLAAAGAQMDVIVVRLPLGVMVVGEGAQNGKEDGQHKQGLQPITHLPLPERCSQIIGRAHGPQTDRSRRGVGSLI
jgi:hypothetical protein